MPKSILDDFLKSRDNNVLDEFSDRFGVDDFSSYVDIDYDPEEELRKMEISYAWMKTFKKIAREEMRKMGKEPNF